MGTIISKYIRNFLCNFLFEMHEEEAATEEGWGSDTDNSYRRDHVLSTDCASLLTSRDLPRFPTATTKSLQLCPTLCDPIDGSPPGSPVPGILQARILEWVAISFSNARKWKVEVKSLSCVRLLATPWTAAHQAPLPMGFSRKEYWSGMPLPSPPRFPRFYQKGSLEVLVGLANRSFFNRHCCFPWLSEISSKGYYYCLRRRNAWLTISHRARFMIFIKLSHYLILYISLHENLLKIYGASQWKKSNSAFSGDCRI